MVIKRQHCCCVLFLCTFIMASFDWNLKRCHTSSSVSPCGVDRLTSLPYDLLTRIVSMLSTKDAAVTQVLSKRMKHAFSCVTNVDLDDSPVSHCVKHPHFVDRFPLFESFIDTVLGNLSKSQLGVTRFRLCFGWNNTDVCKAPHECEYELENACFANPEPTRLYSWISYSLAHCSLTELDLSFRVRNPAKYKLPSGLFAHQSLQVLRLNLNLVINETPVICLPNLKLLCLHSFVFTDDDFVTRLASNCTALEDLTITGCSWVKGDRVIISSLSLRKLVLRVIKKVEEKNSDLVLFDTPNLQYFRYIDNLACHYSITPMNTLVEAFFDVDYSLQYDTFETSFRTQLCVARTLSNAQRLSLHGCFVELCHYGSVVEDPLPMFRNLRTLWLGAILNVHGPVRWDIVLRLILHCSPLLETLIFPEGFFLHVDGTCFDNFPPNWNVVALEADGWRSTQTIPSCFQSRLTRIVVNKCCGCDREVNMMRFLLGNSSILKDFVICLPKSPYGVQLDSPNFNQFKNTLEHLPRASTSCSITYCENETPFI